MIFKNYTPYTQDSIIKIFDIEIKDYKRIVARCSLYSVWLDCLDINNIKSSIFYPYSYKLFEKS